MLVEGDLETYSRNLIGSDKIPQIVKGGSMRGVIAAGSCAAAEAGSEMLALGGNAIDAAVAAAWVSFVSEIGLVNIGGGGYAMVWPSHNTLQACEFYNFFCDMPSGPIHTSIDFHKVKIDYGPEQQFFHIGRASTATPGVVKGLCHLVEKYGRLSLGQTLQPAIRLSETCLLAPAITQIVELLRPIFSHTKSMAAQFGMSTGTARINNPIRLPNFQKSLQFISEQGAPAYYSGNLAEAIVSDQTQHGGLIQMEDLQQYRVQLEKPLTVPYRRGEVHLPGESAFGGVLIAFSLELLNTVSLAGMVVGSLGHYRAIAHALRLTSQLRSKTTHQALHQGIADPHAFEHLLKPYAEAFRDVLNGAGFTSGSREPEGPATTSHISAMDHDGNAISLTTSAGESAGYLVGETGLMMNNMLGEEDINPFGFHQYAPGTRLSSMMSPVVYCENGTPRLAIGSAGSNRLRSAIVQCLCNILDFGMHPQQAIDAPRIHFENGVLQLEGGIPSSVALQLEADGFQINAWQSRDVFFGGAQAVSYASGTFEAGADARRGGGVRVV